jgi:hypothetical protein
MTSFVVMFMLPVTVHGIQKMSDEFLKDGGEWIKSDCTVKQKLWQDRILCFNVTCNIQQSGHIFIRQKILEHRWNCFLFKRPW